MSRIQGLSIELGMASGEIQRSTSEIKRSMRGLSSEAKVVTNNFKYGKRDTDNYRDAVDKLTRTTDKQRENVEELGKRYAKTVEEQGASSKAAQDLAIEYNKQADNLNRLEHELSNMETELAKVTEEQRIAESQWTKTGKAMEEQGEKMKKVGGGMEKVGGIFTAMSAAVIGGAVGITGSLFALTNKATETADAIAKGSERMGISTDFYQEMDFWASQNGLSQDNLEKAVGRLNQRMGLALDGNKKYADALGRLGVDLEAVRDGTLSTEDAMTQSIQALSEMENEHEKAALATEMFGTKLSRELLPALNDGSLSIEDAKQKAEELGLVLSEDQLYAAEAFQDAQDQIKRALGAVTTQIGLDLMPMFQNMMDWVLENMPQIREMIMNTFDRITGAVMSVVEWWKELSDTQRRLIPIIAGVALAFGPIILIAGKVATAIGGIMTVMGPMTASVGAAGGLFSLLRKTMGSVLSPFRQMISPVARLSTTFLRLSNPIGWVITGITALTAGFVLAYRNSDTFREGVDNVVQSVKDAWDWVTTFSSAIYGLFTGEDNSEDLLLSLGLSDETISNITDFVDDTKELFSDMWEFLQDSWERGAEAFGNFWEGIKDIGEWLGDNLAGMWSGLTSGFADALDDLGLELPSLEQVINGAISGISFLMETGFEAGKAAIDTVITTLNSLGDLLTKISDGDWSGAWDVVTGWWDSVKSTWEDAWENIKESFNENFPDFAQIFEDLKTDLTGKSLEIFLGVTKWFIDLKDDMLELGRNIWEGLYNWFEDLRFDTIDLAERLYTGVTGWFSDLWIDGTQYFKDLWNDGKKWFGDLKDDGIELAENLYNGAKEWFMNLPNAMRDALGKVGETIDGWRETLYQKSISMSTRIANGVITGLNWMIRKINQVAGWLDVDQLITPINYVSSGGSSSGGLGTGSLGSISNYSSGTNFHKGGLALVGDRGPGNSPGGSGSGDRSVTRELIKLPNQMELLADGNLLLDLPTGSKVMSNRETEEELKKRALGISHGGGWLEDLTNDILSNIITGAANDAKEGRETGRLTSVARGVGATAQYTTRKLGDFASDLWSYASNPGQLFEEIFNNLINNHLNVPSTFFPMAVGGIGKLKDAVADYIGGLFTKSGKADGRYILNKSISHPFGFYNAMAGSMLYGRRHYGLDTRHNYDPLYSPVSGKVSNTWFDFMGGNSIQVSQGNGRTWWFMHMDSIGVRNGQNVSTGDYLGKTGNTGSFTTGPHLHTQVMEGGIGNSYAIDPFPILNSHKFGGLTESAGLFNLHENEMIVPLNNPTQAMKLIALASKKMAGKSKQTSELPNVAMNNDTVVEKLVEQNSILMKMLEKLTGIESKELSVDVKQLTKAQNRYKDDRTVMI